MKEKLYRNRITDKKSSLLDVFKKMDFLNKKLLIVLEDEKFYGLVSAGDIQRAIIKNMPIETQIKEVLRKNIKIARPNDSYESIKQMMIENRMELCPVVDEKNNIINIYFWEDIFKENDIEPKKQFNLPVVIMAGGLGTRLKPITNVLPKPLIPLGDKTMLEHIFQRFAKHGCNDFYLSVNYKSNLIEFYLTNLNLPYNIHYFEEDKPMGTAGSLSLLKGKISQTFFVSNCDILIEQDYSEILDYHKGNKNKITIVAALKHYSIPYGTVETGDNGKLLRLQEKPELTFKVNSGMYILEPDLLNGIPDNKFFHITHLIEKVMEENGKVGVYPISEKSWKDIGEWDEYFKNKE